MNRYLDRTEAGLTLANQLQTYQSQPDTLVLALPRGGVPIAYEIAKNLNLPLEIFLVRKLGVPGQEELAMGAIAENNIQILNQALIDQLNIPSDAIQTTIKNEEKELKRREKLYRFQNTLPQIANKHIILVDDGIATGATIEAAILAIKELKASSIILAVPVAAEDSLKRLKPMVDKIICPHLPHPFFGVGEWYESFPQVNDKEVCTLLEKAKQFSNHKLHK